MQIREECDAHGWTFSSTSLKALLAAVGSGLTVGAGALQGLFVRASRATHAKGTSSREKCGCLVAGAEASPLRQAIERSGLRKRRLRFMTESPELMSDGRGPSARRLGGCMRPPRQTLSAPRYRFGSRFPLPWGEARRQDDRSRQPAGPLPAGRGVPSMRMLDAQLRLPLPVGRATGACTVQSSAAESPPRGERMTHGEVPASALFTA